MNIEPIILRKKIEEQLILGAFVEFSNAAQSLEVSTEVPRVWRGFDPMRLDQRLTCNARLAYYLGKRVLAYRT